MTDFRPFRDFPRALVAILAMPVLALAGSFEQAIPLRAGWNAIALEVQPDAANPANVFGENPAIDQVVGYVPAGFSVSFLREPGEALRTRAEWPRWYREGPKTILNQLGPVQPRLPYFVHATEATTFRVSGRPVPRPWPLSGGEFIFVSLPVNDQGVVTLSDYFAASNQPLPQVFRLRNNNWEALLPSTALQRGEVYCLRFAHAPEGFFGPLVWSNLPATSALTLNPGQPRVTLDYHAFDPEAMAVAELSVVSGDLPLAYRDGFLDESFESLVQTAALAPIPPGAGGRLTLRASGFGSAVLRLADAAGITAFYLAVENPEPLEENGNDAS